MPGAFRLPHAHVNVVGVAPRFACTSIGVLFRLVWLRIDGTGLDGFVPFARAIYFSKRPPMGTSRWVLIWSSERRHRCTNGLDQPGGQSTEQA